MGTPEFARVVLEKLIASDAYKPEFVITQPDKPAGRKKEIVPPPVKVTAEKYGIPIYQPEKLKNPEVVAKIRKENPDLLVVAAYGKIIPKEILDIPRFGTLNVHASLLPLYRGASPISAAILNDDKETGATIMLIDEQLDHGPILSQARVPIAPNDTTESLSQKIAGAGADLLIETLPEWLTGAVKPRAQNHNLATHTKILTKENDEIKPEMTALQIERMARAFYPWPGIYLKFKVESSKLKVEKEKTLKILRVGTLQCEKNLSPLSFFITTDKQLALQTAQDCLILEIVQPEGKKPMSGYDFYIGHKTILN